jgi:LEA14-like dessication related protein
MVPRRRGVVWTRSGVLALCLGLAACAPHFEKPTLSVVKIDVRGGSFLQQNFHVTFNIHNPNQRTLPVRGVEAQLQVDGDTIATGSSDQPFVVPYAQLEQEWRRLHAFHAARCRCCAGTRP